MNWHEFLPLLFGGQGQTDQSVGLGAGKLCLENYPTSSFDKYRTGIVTPTLRGCCAALCFQALLFRWDCDVSTTCVMCGAHSQTGHCQLCSGVLLALSSPQCVTLLSHGLSEGSHAGVCAADVGGTAGTTHVSPLGLYRDFLLGLWEFGHTEKKPLLRIMKALTLTG